MAKKILLVNDDGIYFPSFKQTVLAFKDLGYEVTVCAPLKPQSAKSHAIEIRELIKFEKIDDFGNIEAYAIDSTPADCVRFARYYLKWDGDVVISGINNGLNLGDDILYSGTVAAAIEAIVRGYKAIALSAEVGKIDEAIKLIPEIIDFTYENDLFSKWDGWSFNMPHSPKGFRLASQGNVNFDTYFKESKPGYVSQLGAPHHELDCNEDSDVYLYRNGYITYSALNPLKTCNDKIKK